MQEEVKLEGSFELDGFDFDVNPPTVRLAASTAPYEKNASPSLRVITGADTINCSSFTHFAITETPVQPSANAFTYTCNQSGSQIISYNLTDTTEGNRKLYFWGMDKNRGKMSSYSSLDFIYDETSPTGTIGALPALVRGGDTQALSLSSGDNIAFDTFTVEFTTDGVSWSEIGTFTEATTSASLNIPMVDSPNGQVRVSYIDRAENSMTLSSSTFTVDSTAPTLSVTDLATYLSGGDTVNITFSTSDLNGMDTWELQYSTDGSSYTTIATDPTSPYAWSVPSTETTTGSIRLVGVDNAGNTDQVSTSNFTVDTTAPSVSLGAISSPLQGGTTTTVTYTVTDASPIASMTLEYAANGTTYTTVGAVSGSSYTWTIPTDNTTASRLRLTATDAAGNSASAISNAFIVDSTPPAVTLDAVGALLRGTNTEAVTFTASDTNGLASTVLNFTSNSGTSYTPVVTNPTSPYTWSIPSLNTTTNQLQLVVTDNAGNVTTVNNATFTIDSTPPSASLNPPGSLLRGGDTEVLTFSSGDTHGVASTSLQYAADGVNFTEVIANPTSPYNWTVPSDDTTNARLRFVVTDNAGNITQVEQGTFTVDSTPPSLSITDLASVIRGGSTEPVNFSATDPAGLGSISLDYAANGTTFDTNLTTTNTSPYSWAVPSVDTTNSRLRLTATDNAGNSTSVESALFNIDSTPPTVTLNDLAAAIQGGSPTTVIFTTSDANGVNSTVLNYAADGTNFSSTLSSSPTSPYSWAVPSVDTTNSRLQLVVTDVVGNSTTVENANFNIDSTPPSLTIGAVPSPLAGGNNQNITFTDSDANGVASLLLEYSLDGISYTTISTNPSSPQSWTIPNGDTVNADIRLTGTDSVGNTVSVTSNTFTIDSTNPTVDITDLAAVIRGGGNTNVTFSASDTSTGIASIDLLYAANGTTFSTIQPNATSPYSWSVPAVNTTGSALRVIATDGAGNTASHTTSLFNIDSTAPSVNLSNMAAIIRGGISNNVVHTKTDANGIASSELFYAEDGTNFVSVTTNPTLTYGWATPSVNAGTARLRLSVTDNAGNNTTVENAAFEIDSTAPTGSISTPPSPILGGSDYSIVFSTTDTAGVASISIEYAANGTTYSQVLSTTNPGPYTWTLPTTDTTGSRIRLVTTDTVGNQAIYTSGTFNIDSTPSAAPSLSLTSPVYTNTTTNTFTAASCGDVASILINEGAQPAAGAAGWQTCTTAANAITYTMGTAQGPHSLRAWSKDSVGNVSTTSTDFTVYYDTILPVIAVSNPGLMRGGASYTLNWTLTEQYINNTHNFTVQYRNGRRLEHYCNCSSFHRAPYLSRL